MVTPPVAPTHYFVGHEKQSPTVIRHPRVAASGSGSVGGTVERRFGDFSGIGEIEAVTVDDELGFIYYADEAAGIHQWHADPDAPGAERELAPFATNGYKQDREGLAIYSTGAGTGFIVSVDQLPDDSIVHLYKREGEPGRLIMMNSRAKNFLIADWRGIESAGTASNTK
jgi:myo-inositol-hexaphosphate 3-phosphohydrolase